MAGKGGVALALLLLAGLFHCAFGQALNCETQTFSVSSTGPVSVAISFDLAVAGFPSFGPQIGQVTFYSWNPDTGAWQTAGTFTGEAAGQQFGAAVTIRSDSRTAFVGAPGASDGAGAVYEFIRSNSTGKWAPSGLVIQGEAAGDALGSAVSATDEFAVFGAPYASSGAGKVYMYQRSSISSPWEVLNEFSGASNGANLGFSVSMAHSGSNCAAGAPAIAGAVAGSATLYCRENDNSTFAPCMEATSWYPSAGDLFGYCVAAFEDSITWEESGLFVGSPGESLAYMKTLRYGAYTYNETVSPPSGGVWGASVAVDTTFNGGVVLPLVGAPQEQGTQATDPAYASALVFAGGYWGSAFVPGPALPNADEAFGSAVALSRGTAMIATQSSVTFWCTGVE